MEKLSVYQQMVNAGVEIDHYGATLYVPVNETTKAIIDAWEFKSNATTFISQIDKKLWYDIPFGYDPEWERKAKIGEAKKAAQEARKNQGP